MFSGRVRLRYAAPHALTRDIVAEFGGMQGHLRGDVAAGTESHLRSARIFILVLFLCLVGFNRLVLLQQPQVAV